MTYELNTEFSETADTQHWETQNIDLGMHYEIATLKLHECALHEPGFDLEKDSEITALENKLLSLQEDILEKTTKVEITNDEDFRAVKNLWQSVTDLKQDADTSLLDQLALSLFQYTERSLKTRA